MVAAVARPGLHAKWPEAAAGLRADPERGQAPRIPRSTQRPALVWMRSHVGQGLGNREGEGVSCGVRGYSLRNTCWELGRQGQPAPPNPLASPPLALLLWGPESEGPGQKASGEQASSLLRQTCDWRDGPTCSQQSMREASGRCWKRGGEGARGDLSLEP